MSNNRNNSLTSKDQITAYIFILIAVIIFLVLIYCLKIDGINFWGDEKIDFAITGQVGDFIAGTIGTLFSAAGFYFLYITLNDQRTSFERERLENKFFDLVKLHRDNVGELKFDATNYIADDDSLSPERVIYESKAVFQVIFNQFIMCRNEILPLFRKAKIYKEDYEKTLLNNPFLVDKKITLKDIAKIDICFNIVFYGINPQGLLILKDIFKNRYDDDFIDYVLRYISLKPAEDPIIHDKWTELVKISTSSQLGRKRKREIVDSIYRWRKNNSIIVPSSDATIVVDYHSKFIKYYSGHQFRLGHYYRHLFQSVNYINSQENINYNEKYEYIKVLRAQLSTHEQATLFLNSISAQGRNWEFDPEISKVSNKFERHDFELITKYNLIKNIPFESMYGIKFRNYYPQVEYENDIETKRRPPYL